MPSNKIRKKSSRSREKGQPKGKPAKQDLYASSSLAADPASLKCLGALLSCLVPLAVYIFFLCPTIAAGDSGELITSAKLLGVPHPPGYPLFTMIGHLFTWIPLQSVAWRVNLSSALFSSLACLFVYLTIFRLTGRMWAALAAAWGLAFSRYFWHYAEVAEVFPLNSFFVAVLTYVLVVLRERVEAESRTRSGSSGQVKMFWLLSFLFGLALTNHQTIVLAVPGALVLLWYATPQLLTAPKTIAIATGCFAFGLTPYLYAPLAAAAQPLINWDNPVTFQSFLDLITRADYGSLSLLPEESQQNVSISRFSQLPALFQSLYHQFTPLGLILALLALVDFKRYKLFKIHVLLGFFFSGIFFVMFANMPITNPLLLGVLRRFYIMPTIFFSFLIGLGMANALSWIKRIKRPKFFQAVTPVVTVGALFIWLFLTNVEEADFRENYLAEDFARNILSSVPENALFFVRGDVASMGVDYLQMVQGERPDVKTLDQAKLTYPWYYKQAKTRFPSVTLPGVRYDGAQTRNVHFVAGNLNKMPVSFLDFKEESYSQAYRAVPTGMVYEMKPKSYQVSPTQIEQQLNDFLTKFEARGLEKDYPPTSFEYEIKQIYAEPFFRLGYEFEQVGNAPKAVTYYEKALQMNPVHFKVMKNLGVVLYYKLNQQTRAVMLFKRYLELNPLDAEAESIQQIVRMYERTIRPRF